MNREEYYQAKHDYRAAMQELSRKYPDTNDRKWRFGFSRIYDAAPKEITSTRFRDTVSSGIFGILETIPTPSTRWKVRCMLPNSYPHATKNP